MRFRLISTCWTLNRDNPRKITMTAKIICHGGVSRKTPEIEKKQKIVEHAANVGMFALTDGRSSIDAVVEAVSIMENSKFCNAGTGSFIQMDGQVRMDAAIMDQNLNVGAVIQISDVQNPVQVARDILKHGVHSILMGRLASEWAHKNGHSFWDPRTEERVETWLSQWKKFRHLDSNEMIQVMKEKVTSDDMLGTVGAVAVDNKGVLAAATSTGGLKVDMPGRVGDVPLVGCGTYCNKFAGISCTGTGEMIIKIVLAKYIADAIEHGVDFEKALDVGLEKIAGIGGRAGFIVISKKGEIGCRFNTEAIAMAIRESQ